MRTYIRRLAIAALGVILGGAVLPIGYAQADTTYTLTIPSGPAGAQGVAGPAGPAGPTGATGAAGASASAASVAAQLAATPSFVAAVAAAMGAPIVVTPPPVIVPPPVVTGSCARPSGNTGSGLYVACGTLRNSDGTQFVINGVNRAHFDQAAANGVNIAGGNATRTFYSYQYGASATFAKDMASLQALHIAAIATPFYNGPATTCDRTGTATLQANVAAIVADASTWKSAQILNIANEWGPAASTIWRDQYISAISALRAAGLTMPLMIDSGGCGQDTTDLLTYAQAVAASDPQSNVVFSTHLYGALTVAQMTTFYAQLGALSKGNGNMAFVVGEFGPGNNWGPSPTMTTPDQVIAAATANGLGWLAWAWDDNQGAACAAGVNWFDLQANACSTPYTGSASQLTPYGVDIVAQFTAHKPGRYN